MEYQPRIVDRLLKELLSGTRAVSIEGPRGVGKTSTGLQLANSIVRLDDPAMRAVVSADHQAYLRNLAPPVLIDEWQLDPPIWDAVRRLVDEEKAKGRFLLTGSANPGDTRIHSGAGRFLRLRMRPLAFSERALMEPTVSLAELWNGSDQVTGTSQITLLDYAQEIVDSGFPGIRPEPPRIRAAALTDYLNYALEHEVSALGGPQRRPLALRHWLRAYAAASSGVASYDAISKAVSRESPPARKTLNEFRETLERLWLLDPVPAWSLGAPRLNQLGSAPKHQLADPALAATLLGTNAEGLLRLSGAGDTDSSLRDLRQGSLFGALFESLVTLSVRTYAEIEGLEVSHLRTHRGDREIDLVLHSAAGKALAIEVKLSGTVNDDDVRHLNWLHREIGPDLVNRVIVTTGQSAYRRTDGVLVVPLALLGP